MNDLSFVYINSEGFRNQYQVTEWKEEGRYISGMTEAGYRTFRKDRIQEYLTPEEYVKTPYTPPPPKVSQTCAPSILFTGFLKDEKAKLETIAEQLNFSVKKTVTKALDFLVCGPNAGPTKISDARERGTFIVSRTQFDVLAETGELIDDPEFHI